MIKYMSFTPWLVSCLSWILVLSVGVSAEKTNRPDHLASSLLRVYSRSSIYDTQYPTAISLGGQFFFDWYSMAFSYFDWQPVYGAVDVTWSGTVFTCVPALAFMLPDLSQPETGFLTLGYKVGLAYPNVQFVGPCLDVGYRVGWLTGDMEITVSNSLVFRQMAIRLGVWVTESQLNDWFSQVVKFWSSTVPR